MTSTDSLKYETNANVDIVAFPVAKGKKYYIFNDLIKTDFASNYPPFYKENTLGRNAARNKARHTSSLSFETLISNASKLLENNGGFCVIIPHSHATEFISLCIENHLYLQRRMDVQSVATKDFNRSMLEFTTSMKNTEHQTLLLYDSEHNRTPEYTRLTTEFYL